MTIPTCVTTSQRRGRSGAERDDSDLGATKRRLRQASDGRRHLPALPLKVSPAAQDFLPGLPSVETTHDDPLHTGHQRRLR